MNINTAGRFVNKGSLEGVRIWLSGSVPEESLSTEEERENIREFVRNFSKEVFRKGGHVIHGSHPSFTPILLEQAKEYLEAGGRKDALQLVVSRFFSNDPQKSSVLEWQRFCLVYETPEATGENALNKSLNILRNWMVARCDVVVVVGGKFWRQVEGKAGVPAEIELSIREGLACFLLGGPGGIASEFIKANPELLGKLKNGFDREKNEMLATEKKVSSLVDTICRQLEQLPLLKGNASDGISFRVLALDGGGIKGAFTAAVLATWEKQTGRRIVDHFDLIAGTSTGGILAIGLGLGLSAQQMLDFYKERGPEIFPTTSWGNKLSLKIRHLFQPKYSQEKLLAELEKAYYKNNKPQLMKDSRCRLVIPAYYALSGASHVFHTPHAPTLTMDANIETAHVALATAAAPTYFSATKIGNMIAESMYFDGGVWANSPAMAAIIETTCFLNVSLDRIDVLSIGTTEEPFIVKKQTRSGLIGWGFFVGFWKLLHLLTSVQTEASQKYAKLLVGEPRFLRVNVPTQPGIFSIDGSEDIEVLASLGNHEATKPDVLAQVQSRFLNGVIVTPWKKFD